MPITDALRDYAEEKIGNAMKVMDIDPLTAEVVLEVEKNPANPTPACCEVTMRARGHIIRVEEHEGEYVCRYRCCFSKGFASVTQI